MRKDYLRRSGILFRIPATDSKNIYSDIINGKIKKLDVEKIKKISDGLELPFERLLRLTHYKVILDYLGV